MPGGLREIIQLNVKDKCDSLTTNGKCMIGCWNCQVSTTLLAILDIHYAIPLKTTDEEYCIDCEQIYPCLTVKAMQKELA